MHRRQGTSCLKKVRHDYAIETEPRVGYSGGCPQGKVGQQSSLDPLPFVRIALDEKLALTAGLMLPVTRRAGLSFGDRACLAPANKLSVRAITANRAWPHRISR